jgi:hypothetical protein
VVLLKAKKSLVESDGIQYEKVLFTPKLSFIILLCHCVYLGILLLSPRQYAVSRITKDYYFD